MKTVVVALPADEYKRLAERAEASDRDPHQQARHLIRQALTEQKPTERAAWPMAPADYREERT